VVLGVLAGLFLPDMDDVAFMIATGVGIVAGTFVHILIHEGGHLVCGLLSGYRFVSYRVGSCILIKRNGKYALKKFSIPGTGGQCLLDPPEADQEGRYPVKLYNFGGGLANFIFSGLAMIGAFTIENGPFAMVLLTFGIFGITLGLMNLIPLKAGGIANDGYNILSLDKDPTGRKAFWQQLRVNRLQSDGMRLKDMDPGLFDLAQSETEGNPLIDQMKLFYLQRLLDEKRLEEAADYGRRLAHAKDSIQLFQLMVGVELLYLELIGTCDAGVVNALYSKDIEKWLKVVKGYPSTHRVRYAYAVRFAHDDKMASKAAAAFEKACRSYPMAGEIETEKELFEAVRSA